MKLIYRVANLIKIAVKIKIYISCPKENKILLYDRLSKRFAEALFMKKNFAFYDVRFESINLYVFFFTLLNSGLKELKINYKFNYFNFVKPEIIYTCIDNNISFFRLKKLYPNALYIADQFGMRNNIFFNECKKFIKKFPDNALRTDIFFCFGSNEKERLEKIIQGNIMPLGNTINNHFRFKKNKKKTKNIIFISSSKYKQRHIGHKIFLDREIKIFLNLLKFCEIKKIKLYFLDKPHVKRYLFLKKRIGREFNYLNSKDRIKNYSLIKKDSLFVFIFSTFGYEVLSKGVKCVSLNHTLYNHGLKKYKKKGPFWINAPTFNYNYELIKRILNTVINYNEKKWEKIYKYYSRQILVYDRNNNFKKQVIKNHLRKKKW